MRYYIALPPILEACVDRVGVGVGVLGTAGDLMARKMLVSMTFVYNRGRYRSYHPD